MARASSRAAIHSLIIRRFSLATSWIFSKPTFPRMSSAFSRSPWKTFIRSLPGTSSADTLAHRSLSEDEVPGRLRIKVFHGDRENAEGIRGNVGFEKIQDVASENLRIISDWIAARDEGRAINLDRRKHFHFHREKCSRELA